jgi:group I intron endonuclease
MYKKCGIYKITSIANNKIYIGQSVDIDERRYEHFRKLNTNIHGNKHLQNSYNKYGESNFKFEIIEICEKQHLNAREYYWINFYKSHLRENGFNIHMPTDDERVYELSDETKRKLAEINTVYSDDELLEFLRKYHKEFGVVPKQDDLEINKDYPSSRTYKSRFGSFNKAIKEANLDSYITDDNRLQRRRSYSEDEVVSSIHSFVSINKRLPYHKDFDDKSNNLPSRRVINKHFGSIEKCMEFCGYEYSLKRKKKFTKDEIIKLTKKYVNENSEFPRYDDFKSCEYLPNPTTVLSNFGSLSNLREVLFD